MLLAISFLLWLQGNIIKWNYGAFTGIEINFQKNFIFGIIDSCIWIFFIVFALLKFSFFFKRAKKISLAFIIIQVVSLIIAAIQAPMIEGKRNLGVDQRTRFKFSKEKNIIILVVDTFQTDIFQEILTEDSEQKVVFKDFTYFRNSLGGYPTTVASIPLILTGIFYENSEPFYSYMKRVYTTKSIPKVLMENGYRVHLFTFANVIFKRKDIASNFIKKKAFNEKIIYDSLYIYDISLFRQLPHFLKKFIWNNQAWFLKRIFAKMPQIKYLMKKRRKKGVKKNPGILTDLLFFKLMKTKTIVDKSSPTFKFYHLKGLHPPLWLSDRCEIEKLAFNRKNYKNQAKCFLAKIKGFLDILKSKGIYYNSMIFIIGDHGPGNWGLTEINVKASGYSTTNKNRDETLNRVKSGALPLFLVKPFKVENQGELRISDAPVSLADIPKTIFSELGINLNIPGISIFSLKDSDKRRRRYLYYAGFPKWGRSGYLHRITEYHVTGFSWLDESWSQPIKVFIREDVKQ